MLLQHLQGIVYTRSKLSDLRNTNTNQTGRHLMASSKSLSSSSFSPSSSAENPPRIGPPPDACDVGLGGECPAFNSSMDAARRGGLSTNPIGHRTKVSVPNWDSRTEAPGRLDLLQFRVRVGKADAAPSDFRPSALCRFSTSIGTVTEITDRQKGQT